jgi:cytoskeletal protein RodZ
MDIGGELRAAREARSLSIDDIAHTTKISPRVLRAIEANAFDTVPRGPFMRGYLMAYARQVGLDGDDLVRRYREEFEAPEPPPSAEPAVLSSDGPLDPADTAMRSSTSQMLQIGVIIVVVGAVVYLGTQRQPNPAAPRVDVPGGDAAHAPATATSDAALAPATAPSATAPIGTTGGRDTKAAELTMEIWAAGPCWVHATIDGKRVLAQLMDAGDFQTIAVREGLAIRVGEPSTFAFTIDGVAGRPLGPAGRPVTVRIEPANYRDFLVAK